MGLPRTLRKLYEACPWVPEGVNGYVPVRAHPRPRNCDAVRRRPARAEAGERTRGAGRILRGGSTPNLDGEEAAVVSVDHVVDEQHELAVVRRPECEGLSGFLLI